MAAVAWPTAPGFMNHMICCRDCSEPFRLRCRSVNVLTLGDVNDVVSPVPCTTNSGRCKSAIRSGVQCRSKSSKNSRETSNGLPAIDTVARPVSEIFSTSASVNKWRTWSGLNGAATATTALTEEMLPAASNVAAPPRL